MMDASQTNPLRQAIGNSGVGAVEGFYPGTTHSKTNMTMERYPPGN